METDNNIETKVLDLLSKGYSLFDVVRYVRTLTLLKFVKLQKRSFKMEQLMIDEQAKKYFYESYDYLNGVITDVDKHCHYKFLEGENVVLKDLIEHCNDSINNFSDILKSFDK